MNVICVLSIVYVWGGRAHERNLRIKHCLRLGGGVRMNVICVLSIVYVWGGRAHERNLRIKHCLCSGGGRAHERNLRIKHCLRLGGGRAHERNLRIKHCLRLGGGVRMNVICVLSIVYVSGGGDVSRRRRMVE